MSIIKLNNVSKFYRNKNSISSGFTKINLELDMGEFVVITGESGSGKSTLLNVISGLDSYEEGEMYINGDETSHYTEVDYESYRRKYIGNIFQHFNLVNSYTVFQNIELVLLLNGYKKKEVKSKILDIIDTVGLTKYKNTKVSKLSGGQKQRVAIARALAKDTPIIVADEPTGNLDVKSAKAIMKLLSEISKDKLVIIVTHNYEQVEEYTTRKITMNDGRIIEDKKLKEKKSVKVKEAEYKNIKWYNLLKLSIRNAFNIKVKFGLLFIVYLFLTIVMFSEYTSLQKNDYDQTLEGYNYLFIDTNPNRVILNKTDKTSFTDDEINAIKNISNIKSIVENDITIDMNISVYNDKVNFYSVPKSINEIKKVDLGRMPQNNKEIIIGTDKHSFYVANYLDNILEKNFTISNAYSSSSIGDDYVVVGIKYVNTEDYDYNDVIYMNSDIEKEIRKQAGLRYSTRELEIDNHVLTQEDTYFSITPNKLVPEGHAYIYDELNYKCSGYNMCKYKNLQIRVDNVYYSEQVTLYVSNVINKNNIQRLTGIKNIENAYNTIFINSNDYDKLYNKGTYQISIYLDNDKLADETLNELGNMGYNTYHMKKMLTVFGSEFMEIARLIMVVMYIISIIILFFVSYFIIKIIIKGRNVYFSTIRILGATRKNSNKLLNLELLIDASVAYLVFVLLIYVTNMNILNISYIKDLAEYLKLIDYLVIYVALLVMSLLISNRYSRKLFKESALNAYREEV